MYQVIVNPGARSGKGRRHWEEVKNVLDSRGHKYAVHFTNKAGDAADYAVTLYKEALAKNEVLKLIVLGGDGTMNEVMQGLPEFDNLELSCIPVGSSNDLARGIGISFNPKEAIEHILDSPVTFNMDLGIVHSNNSSANDNGVTIPDRRFLVSTGFGYDAAICEEANASGAKKLLNRIGLGKLVYLLICLKQLISVRDYSTTLILENGKEIKLDRLLLIAGMNNMYEGGGFKFAPAARNDDGKIDLCVVSGLSRSKVLQILPQAMKGNHYKFDGVDAYQSSIYTVKSQTPLWVHTDGEALYQADCITVECIKNAIKMIY